MRTKQWPKFVLLLLIACQITCINWNITVQNKKMYIFDAVVRNQDNFNEVDFSKVEEVEFDHPDIEVLTLQLQSPMRKVKELAIYKGNVSIVQVATWLEKLSIDRSNTHTVEIVTGSSYKAKTLEVTYCKLKTFPKNLSAMKNLLNLNLDGNLIETVNMAELNGMKSLRVIKLSKNKFTTISFSQAVLPGMKLLELNYNGLKDIRLDGLEAPLFEVLNLKGNQMETADMTRFSNFNLQLINLNENKIKKIVPDSVTLPKLELFSISSNPISEIDFQKWNTPLIQTLDVSHCQLKTIPGLATKFPSLQILYLFPNPFECTWLNTTINTLEAKDVLVLSKHESNCH